MVASFLSAVPSAGLHWLFRMVQITVAMAVAYLAYLVVRRGWLVSASSSLNRLKTGAKWFLQPPHATTSLPRFV